MNSAALLPCSKEESELSPVLNPHSGETVRSQTPPEALQTLPAILGNRGAQRSLATLIQPKLTIGARDDIYEKEADEVAEQVVARTRLAAAGSSGPDDEGNGSDRRGLAGGAANQRSVQRNVLQRISIRTLQQNLGNHAVARLLQQTLPTPAATELRRKCGCGGNEKEECAECRKNRIGLQRSSSVSEGAGGEAPPIVEHVLATPGQPLADSVRRTLEPGFGHDFSGVRVHDDSKAAESASAVNALAYTVGNHIVFGAGQYSPGTAGGDHLLAHELTHTIQQTGGIAASIQRACLPAASCVAPPGSASVFGAAVTSAEAAARARRAAMSRARQRATGHTGPARALEDFLNGQAPGLLGNIHGIFIDQDMDANVEASTQDCASMTPPILGATKPCVFVHGHLNQEAFKFNTDPAATTIGGQSREDWRIGTVQTLTHEVQHVRYDTALGGAAAPVGVACARADVESELSELNAILSEFPSVFNAVPAGAPAADPARVRLDNWFRNAITNASESIRGTLKQVDCKCSCSDTDAYVRETFSFVTGAWTTPQKDALNAELRRPVWSLRWPL